MPDITLTGTASYPHLAAPQKINPADPNEDAKYSMTIILWPQYNDIPGIQATVNGLLQQTWPQGIPPKAKSALKYGDVDDPGNESVKGKYYVKCSSKFGISLVDVSGRPMTDPKTIETEIYAGSTVKVFVTLKPQNPINPLMSRGVFAYLQCVQKVGDGPRLDNRKMATDVFKPTEVINAPGFVPGTEAPPPAQAPNQVPAGQPPASAAGYQQVPAGQPDATAPPAETDYMID